MLKLQTLLAAPRRAASHEQEGVVKRIGRAADGDQAGHSENAADCAFSLLQ